MIYRRSRWYPEVDLKKRAGFRGRFVAADLFYLTKGEYVAGGVKGVLGVKTLLSGVTGCVS